MLGDAIGKKFSVKQRLMTLGGAAVFGIASMLGVGWYQSAGLVNPLPDPLRSRIRSSASMKCGCQYQSGADCHGQHHRPQRRGNFADRLAAPSRCWRKLEQLLLEGRGTAVGESDKVMSYDADLALVRKAIETDLKLLIETGAPEERYAEIDNVIDDAGERISVMLNDVSVARAT